MSQQECFFSDKIVTPYLCRSWYKYENVNSICNHIFKNNTRKMTQSSLSVLIHVTLFGIIARFCNSGIDGYLDEINLSHSLQTPRIGFGTAAMGGKTKEIVCSALSVGIRLFDTAQAVEWYDEEGLGKALASCWNEKDFDELIIVTKIHPRSFEHEKMKKAIERSQLLIYRKQRALDVILLHAPYCYWYGCTEEDKRHTWQQAWKNLEQFQNEGIVNAIGVSNFDVSLLQELYDIANKRISVVQNWMDPFRQDKETRAFCLRHNIAYMAYSSLGTQWEMKLGHNPVFQDSTLQAIATKHSKSNHSNISISIFMFLCCVSMHKLSFRSKIRLSLK